MNIFYACINLIFGIILSNYFSGLDLLIVAGIYILAYYLLTKIAKLELDFNLAFFFIGILILTLSSKTCFTNYYGKYIEMEGYVNSYYKENSYTVDIVKINSNDEAFKIKEKIRLKVEDSDLNIGDYIKFKGKLRPLEKGSNPKLFNEELYLKSKKITGKVNLKSYESLSVKQGNKIGLNIKNFFNNYVKTTFNNYLNEDQAKFLSAVVLADSNILEEATRENFRLLGLSHILAVSGLHINLITMIMSFIISKLNINYKLGNIILLISLWAYGYLIAFPISALRAIIMASIFILAKISLEGVDRIKSLSLAVIITLFINPYNLFSIGFQLSYGAVLSIILLYERFEYLNEDLNSFLKPIILIGAIQIGTLPIIVYYFNEINLLNFLSNITILHIVSGEIILGFLLLIFNILKPLALLIKLFLSSLYIIRELLFYFILKLSFLKFNFYSPSIWAITIYYLLLYFIINRKNLFKIDKSMREYFTALIAFIIIYSQIYYMIMAPVEIHFIDVNQGDCILIKSSRNYLIDTGGEVNSDFSIGENITWPYLIKHNVKKLNSVFISHYDLDHCKALDVLIEKMPINKLYSSYEPEGFRAYDYFKSQNKSKILKYNDHISLDKNINGLVISPKDLNNKSANDNSLGLILNIHNEKFFFTGDIEKDIEANLVNDPNLRDIKNLKIPHHGSNTSSTEEFLKSMDLENVFISVGRNNLYNHPHDEVIKRLEDLNLKIYRTDTDGRILVKINRFNTKIESYLHKKLKIFDIIDFVYFLILAYLWAKEYKGEYFELQGFK